MSYRFEVRNVHCFSVSHCDKPLACRRARVAGSSRTVNAHPVRTDVADSVVRRDPGLPIDDLGIARRPRLHSKENRIARPATTHGQTRASEIAP